MKADLRQKTNTFNIISELTENKSSTLPHRQASACGLLKVLSLLSDVENQCNKQGRNAVWTMPVHPRDRTSLWCSNDTLV
jgi:hypothetical protein